MSPARKKQLVKSQSRNKKTTGQGGTIDNSIGIYIHIPFCESKCSYCDFASISGFENLASVYVDSLEREISQYAKRLKTGFLVESVYIGGGTPTCIGSALICKILKAVKSDFSPMGRSWKNVEISMEANPESVARVNIKSLLSAGVNRMSIGVQSFSDKMLRRLGRLHDSTQARQAVHAVQKAGCENISIDLMFGLPEQKRSESLADIEEALKLPVKHISAYALTPEEGTPLADMIAIGKTKLPPESAVAGMFEKTISVLASRGFHQYEISNFAITGSECRHNVRYWQNRQYIGFGSSAVSYLNGERRGNISDPRSYVKAVMSGRDFTGFREKLEPLKSAGETIIMGLRMMRGISWLDLQERYGFDPREKFPFARLESAGLLKSGTDGARLTAKGIMLANEVFREFV